MCLKFSKTTIFVQWSIYIYEYMLIFFSKFWVCLGIHGHTPGAAPVANRLRPTSDPALDPAYAAQLSAACPGGGADRAVNNSPVAPDTLSNQYYRNALAGRVLLTSDAALLTRGDTAARVNASAADATAWMARFAAAMARMAGIEVLTGAQGEVRRLCNVTNN